MAHLCRRMTVLAPSFCRIVNKTTVPFLNYGKINMHLAQSKQFCSARPLPQKERVEIKFVKYDGQVFTANAKVGDNLLDVIIDHDFDFDGFGACEGTLACSTCHLIFKESDFKSIPEKATDEELDMLDLAYALSDTSRLGCQVIVTKAMEGWEVKVPQGVADAREP